MLVFSTKGKLQKTKHSFMERDLDGIFPKLPFSSGASLGIFRTAVPFWRQCSQTGSSLSPKRDCVTEKVKACFGENRL